MTRGLCRVEGNHSHVVDVVETRNIVKTPEGAQANGVDIDLHTLVSMNMWGFPAKEGCDPHFLEILEEHFEAFFREEVSANPLKSEYLLPTLIGAVAAAVSGYFAVKWMLKLVQNSNFKWFSVYLVALSILTFVNYLTGFMW